MLFSTRFRIPTQRMPFEVTPAVRRWDRTVVITSSDDGLTVAQCLTCSVWTYRDAHDARVRREGLRHECR